MAAGGDSRGGKAAEGCHGGALLAERRPWRGAVAWLPEGTAAAARRRRAAVAACCHADLGSCSLLPREGGAIGLSDLDAGNESTLADFVN